MDDTAIRAKEARATCPYLTTKQAAFHLGICESTLRKLRTSGRGPIGRLHGGRLQFHIDDIEAWSVAQRSGGGHADRAALPLLAWGDRASVRQAAPVRKLGLLALAGGGIALLAFAIVPWSRPHLVWNASASAPRGLYAVHPGSLPARGDMVIAWPPRQARALAAARHYLPANVPLVKRVVALSGDRVCAVGRSIEINGRHAATRLERDSIGRPLPWWRGCRTLGNGALFLLTDAPGSFDGRYFGLSDAIDLIGKATPLWLR